MLNALLIKLLYLKEKKIKLFELNKSKHHDDD